MTGVFMEMDPTHVRCECIAHPLLLAQGGYADAWLIPPRPERWGELPVEHVQEDPYS